MVRSNFLISEFWDDETRILAGCVSRVDRSLLVARQHVVEIREAVHRVVDVQTAPPDSRIRIRRLPAASCEEAFPNR